VIALVLIMPHSSPIASRLSQLKLFPAELNSDISPSLTHFQLVGISKGISSFVMGATVFLELLVSEFSAWILSNNASAS